MRHASQKNLLHTINNFSTQFQNCGIHKFQDANETYLNVEICTTHARVDQFFL